MEAPVKIMMVNWYFKCYNGVEYIIKDQVAPMLPEHLLRLEYAFSSVVRKIPKGVKLYKPHGKYLFRIEYIKQVGESNKNIGMAEKTIN